MWAAHSSEDPMSDYRSPWMDSDLDALLQPARALYQTAVLPCIDKLAEQHQVDRELWNGAGELDLLCLSVPEEYGGGGGGTFAHEAVMIEEQGRIGDSS
jgi:acyl-CoA dehydrogenase